MANMTPKFFLMLQTIYINSLMHCSLLCEVVKRLPYQLANIERNNLPDNFHVLIDL